MKKIIAVLVAVMMLTAAVFAVQIQAEEDTADMPELIAIPEGPEEEDDAEAEPTDDIKEEDGAETYGEVIAVGAAESVAGDCNGDGEVNNKDVVTLFRYVSSGEKADDETVYDFNGDGEVDNKDVVALFRAVSESDLSGEPEETEEPSETEEPEDTDEPDDTEEVIDIEEPDDTEEVIDTEEPDDTEEVIDTEEPDDTEEVIDTEEPDDTVTDEAPADTYNDGVIGGRDPSGYEYDEDMDYPAMDGEIKGGDYPDRWEEEVEYEYGEPECTEIEAVPEPCEDCDIPVEPGYNDVDAVAGTLSAGEWKDSEDLAGWFNFLEKYNRFVNSRALNTKNVIKVKVVDGENACFNVPVKLLSGDDVLFAAKTDVNGCAYLFHSIAYNEEPDAILVGHEKISLDGKTEFEVEAKDAGIAVTALDLMLMIDTTGSMGDELEYIKAELYDVVSRVAEADQSLSIRISVNFYRDEGDIYVVKYYDFREDVNECIEQLKEQHAAGGGDYPEAVHTALDNAVAGHKWREEAVKICFMVLDAPPHPESEIQGVNAELLNTVKTAAEQGIRIIPVASSGVDEETEFLLRSWALMTGGTYVFITDDSGVGYGHKEAEVGEHTVEYLNNCMVRIVCEYCGIYTGEVVPYTPPYHQ